MNIMKLNGDMLKDARDEKALTGPEAAVKIGITAATLNRAENGGDVHPSTGKRIAEFYDLDIARLVVTRIPRREKDGDAA